MRPVIALISDRHRASEDTLIARVRVAALAGVHLVQIRERDMEAAPLVRLVARAVEAVRATPARVVVNDRIDVALAAGAHGVHLRSQSMPASRVRHITPPGFLIGRSVHEWREMTVPAVVDGLDYVLFGTVFETLSKPGRVPSGLEALARIVSVSALPVLALGGVTVERARDVARTGAAGFAAIGLFMSAPPDAIGSIVAACTAAFSGDAPATIRTDA